MASGLVQFKVGARTAPLGLRFWDPVASAFVGDGLRVTAYPVADPSRRVEAVANPSRVWVFHKLPGLGAVQRGEGDAAFWQPPPPKRSYRVEVDDDLGRFLSFQLVVDAPVRGPLEWTPPVGVTLPGVPPGALPLFSSAMRAAPQGIGVIRAELWDPNAATPAAWAVLTAKVGKTSGVRAMADRQGRVALMFPYPAPEGMGIGGLITVPLSKQTWPVELTARYAPAAGAVPARAKLPEALQQATATLWQEWAAAPAARKKLVAGMLAMTFGRELVVKTVGTAQGAVLYVTSP